MMGVPKREFGNEGKRRTRDVPLSGIRMRSLRRAAAGCALSRDKVWKIMGTGSESARCLSPLFSIQGSMFMGTGSESARCLSPLFSIQGSMFGEVFS